MKKPLLVLSALVALIPLPASAGATSSTGLDGARWNPCVRVTYAIRGHGYAEAHDDFRHAVRTMARATGIRIVEVPGDDADISVRWTTPATNPNLRGYVVGATSSVNVEHDDVHETIGAWIDLDRTAHLRHGFPTSGAPAWGQVFLHELGHALGLAHVPGRDQVMNPVTSRYNHVLGRGDLARLHRVGRAAGCIPDAMR